MASWMRIPCVATLMRPRRGTTLLHCWPRGVRQKRHATRNGLVPTMRTPLGVHMRSVPRPGVGWSRHARTTMPSVGNWSDKSVGLTVQERNPAHTVVTRVMCCSIPATRVRHSSSPALRNKGWVERRWPVIRAPAIAAWGGELTWPGSRVRCGIKTREILVFRARVKGMTGAGITAGSGP